MMFAYLRWGAYIIRASCRVHPGPRQRHVMGLSIRRRSPGACLAYPAWHAVFREIAMSIGKLRYSRLLATVRRNPPPHPRGGGRLLRRCAGLTLSSSIAVGTWPMVRRGIDAIDKAPEQLSPRRTSHGKSSICLQPHQVAPRTPSAACCSRDGQLHKTAEDKASQSRYQHLPASASICMIVFRAVPSTIVSLDVTGHLWSFSAFLVVAVSTWTMAVGTLNRVAVGARTSYRNDTGSERLNSFRSCSPQVQISVPHAAPCYRLLAGKSLALWFHA